MNIQLISLYLIIIFTLSKIIIERVIYSNKTINIKVYLKDSIILYISFNLLYYLLKNYEYINTKYKSRGIINIFFNWYF